MKPRLRPTRQEMQPTATHLDTGRLPPVSRAARRWLVHGLWALSLAGGSALVSAQAALAANLCVGSRSGCFSTLQAAVNTAHDGDTIAIAPGTYAGGVTIDVSLRIVGAGAGSTVIRGGGSVLTIGVYGASTEPTVSISGVTITGGVARSSPESIPFTGAAGVIARGGGVEIPPNKDFTGGATVTISNSVITGNRAAPTRTLATGPPCPGNVRCPYAEATGGGIDSWGTLTLAHTTVSNNSVGTASGLSTIASDANGGAIANELGPLTINDSTISGNHASASAPNGRFADSGAMILAGGTVTMNNSTVSDNRASLAASEPNPVAANPGAIAIAGAIHVEGGVTAATFSNSTITGNSVSMTNTLGDATAFSGGLHTDGVFTLINDIITDNSVYSATLPGSSGNAEGDSAAGEMAGTINNTRLADNTVTVRSAAGTATALAGATIVSGTLTNSIVSANHVFASSPTGNAVLAGAGLQAAGPLTLQNTTVRGNTGYATGLSGSAQGGGISDVDLSGIGQPPGGPLELTNSRVVHNRLSGSPAITLKGGGIAATKNPVTLSNSLIAHNHPDQCDGC
jgi:hypothetical protein